TGTLQTMGTPRYMSPEQMRTTRDVDPRSDLWSLGVILYELLSGASPFEAETVPLLYSKVLSDPPRELRTVAPHLPLGLSLVVMKCLEKDPEYRFSRIDALVEALAPFAQAQGQISRPRIALVFNDAEHPSPSLSEEMLQRATQPTLSADDLPSPMAATQSRTTPSAAVLPPAPPASTSPASTSPEAPVPAGASRPSPLRWALPLAAGAALLALLALRRDEPSPPASLAPPPSMSSSPATTVMPPVEPLPAASPREPGAPSAAPPLSSERPVAAKKQAPTTMSARPSPPPPRPAPPGADLYGARH
nr:protein kinase [Polyangiaceae bacterium]